MNQALIEITNWLTTPHSITLDGWIWVIICGGFLIVGVFIFILMCAVDLLGGLFQIWK
jgi:hypothetical protein